MYGVAVLVFKEWKMQKTGLTGAEAGNLQASLNRMGYTAKVFYLGNQ